MTVNRKPTGTTCSIPKGIAIGVLVAILTTLSLIFIIAKFVQLELVRTNSVGYSIIAILILSSGIGTITAIEKIKRQKLMLWLVWNLGALFLQLLWQKNLVFH